MKKRFAAGFLAVLMLISLLSAFCVTFAETYSGTCGDYVNWSLDTDTGVLSITGTGEMTFDIIPPWCNSRNHILHVIIENGVTSIADSAFHGCTGLTSVSIPDSVTSIGNSAFSSTALCSITIPSSVMSIGKSVFFHCTRLSDITVDSNSNYYYSENNVLYNKEKTSLIFYSTKKTDTSFVIPDSVISIEPWAFSQCSNLKNIEIPYGVIEIGRDAFNECTGIENITIPDSVTSIGEGAFNCCDHAKNIKLSASITKIESATFVCCDNISDIVIPTGVTSIGPEAFYSCTCLTSITIPNSVERIYPSAFFDCFQLSDIHYYGFPKQWEEIEIGLNNESLLDANLIYEIICDHEWDDGIITKAATCSEEGEILCTCSICRETKTETIEKIPHTWATEYSVDLPAGAVTDGQKSIHCTVCDAVKPGSNVILLASFSPQPNNPDFFDLHVVNTTVTPMENSDRYSAFCELGLVFSKNAIGDHDVRVLDYGILYGTSIDQIVEFITLEKEGGDTSEMSVRRYQYQTSEIGISRFCRKFTYRFNNIKFNRTRGIAVYIRYECDGEYYEEFSPAGGLATFVGGYINGVGSTLEETDGLDD